jgi:GNAT superfamily N-acetyltransferase
MNQFKIHQIKSTEDQYFAEFWEIYTTSFPLDERRVSEQEIAVFEKTEYQVNGYLSEDHLIGFIAFWTAKAFIFIEHFAVAPEVQGKGFGHIILKQFIEGEAIPVILEIEPPVDDLTNRRLRFYESAGFVKNKHLHFQPPYHTEASPLQLNILTFPHQITPDLYLQFSLFQINIVMG